MDPIISYPNRPVTYANETCGYPHDQRQCQKYLKLGERYTLAKQVVRSASTSYWLAEVPGQEFNSVMFDDPGAAEPKPAYALIDVGTLVINPPQDADGKSIPVEINTFEFDIDDPEHKTRKLHKFKITPEESGMCITFGGGETKDSPSVYIERQIDRYLIVVHGDDGDPACTISIDAKCVEVMKYDHDEVIHKVDRHVG
jgi:hypothetical protein